MSPRPRMLSVSTMTAQRQERYGSCRGMAFFGLLAGHFDGRLARSASRGHHDRARGDQPLSPDSRSKDSIRSPISRRRRGHPGAAGLRGRPRRRGLAFPQRGQPRLVRGRIRKSTARSSAATIRPISVRGVTCAGNPRFWAVVGNRLYLFNREDTAAMPFAADPARFLTEAVARWPELRRQSRAVDHRYAAAGSPQAMNSGTRKSLAAQSEMQRGALADRSPCRRAATTTAVTGRQHPIPDVGERRG